MGEETKPPGDEQVLQASAQLRRMARGLLYDAHGADDVVQEAWVAALRKGRHASWGPRAWIAGAVRKLALSRRREDARRVERERRAARSEALPGAGSAVERLEVSRRVMDAVEALDEPYRSAILLRFFDDLPPREIARREGVPVNTVRTWVRRGLERLRRDLDPQEDGDRARFLGGLAPLAGLSPWPITLGLPPGSWQVVSKWTGGMAMGKALQVGFVGAAALLALFVGARWMGDGVLPEPTDSPGAAADRELALEGDELRPGGAGAGEHATMPAAVDAGPGRSAVQAEELVFVVRGYAFRGSSTVYPGAPLLARLHATEERGGQLLQEQRLVSAADGSFAWALPQPEGSVTVSVTPQIDEHLVYPASQFVVAGNPAPTDLEVRLHPLDLTVEGRVVDTDGEPIAGAQVGISQDRDQARSDERGYWRVRSSSTFSSIAIYARAEGFAAGRTMATNLGEPRLKAEDVVLVPETCVVGRVTDESGAPVVGARVSDSPLVGIETLTDEDGRYALPGQDPEDDRYWVLVDAEGLVRGEAQVPNTGTTEVEHDFVLRRGAAVRGHVRDAEGGALEGVALTLGYSPEAFPQLATVSASDGGFEFPAVGAGGQLLWAERAGLATLRHEVEVPEDGSPLELELVLQQGAVVQGRVVDEGGHPIPHASVSIARIGNASWDDDYVAPHTRTDSDGRFRFDQLPGATLEVDVFTQGCVRAKLRVPALDGTPLEIVMQRAGLLSGRVVDGLTGEPIEEFTVRFVDPWLEQGEQRLWSYSARWSGPGFAFVDTGGRWEARGRFRVGDRIGVEVRAEGYAPAVDDRVAVRDPREAEPVIALHRGSRIGGQVLDGTSGLPLEGVRVRRFGRAQPVRMEAGGDEEYELSWESTTGPDGRFELEGVPGGVTRLGIQAEGFTPLVDGPFEVHPSGERVEREIRLDAGGVILGQLLDAAGRPLAQERIQLDGLEVDSQERIDAETTTDAEGRFRLAGLPDGRYQVNHRAVVAGHEFYALCRSVRIAGGAPVELELRPLGRARVEGSLRSELELPENLTVWIGAVAGEDMEHAEQVRRSRGTPVSEGRFRVEGLEAGEYFASVDFWTDEGHASGSVRFEVADGGLADVLIDVKRY